MHLQKEFSLFLTKIQIQMTQYMTHLDLANNLLHSMSSLKFEILKILLFAQINIIIQSTRSKGKKRRSFQISNSSSSDKLKTEKNDISSRPT